MSREAHVRFFEGLGGEVPLAYSTRFVPSEAGDVGIPARREEIRYCCPVGEVRI